LSETSIGVMAFTSGPKSVMQNLLLESEFEYTGQQLRSLWAYEEFGLAGDSIVAFVGRCDVQPEYMADMEDLRAGARIFSERMLHFIVEHFDHDLARAVLRQRLLIAVIAERLNVRLAKTRVTRRGDDLFEGERKLTVSIATLSPMSSLIHAGVNILSRDTPVPAVGLADYAVEPRGFAQEILAAYVEEMDGADRARCKVRPSP